VNWQKRLWEGFLLLCALAALWQFWPWPIHRAISVRSIERVEVRPKGEKAGHAVSNDEARQLIAWFNSATGVKDNWHHAGPGCGEYSYVIFHLRSGETVEVSSYMRATRYKDPKSNNYTDYYFKQPELEQYLREINQRVATTGC